MSLVFRRVHIGFKIVRVDGPHGAVGILWSRRISEPYHSLIFEPAGQFVEFFVHMAPVTMPVLAVGLTTCIVLE